MTLVVEDGTARADANAYISPVELATYVASYGRVWDEPDGTVLEGAIRVATRYIDNTYRNSFSGQRKNRREQGLEWPRNNAYARDDAIGSSEIPKELKEATCEAALREIAKPGRLTPDVRAGGPITDVKADSVSVSFGGAGFTGLTNFQQIGALIGPLLQGAGSQGVFSFGVVERC